MHKYIFIPFLLLGLYGCITPIDSEPEFHSLSPAEVRTQVSKSLAQSLNDITINEFLKTSILESFDGDYNVLWIDIANRIIPGMELTFGDWVWSQAPIRGFSNLHDFNEYILDVYPLLQIAMPEISNASAENWDLNPSTWVVAKPATTEVLKATGYNISGEQMCFSMQEPPNELVLVINTNERIIIRNKSEDYFPFVHAYKAIFQVEDQVFYIGEYISGNINPPNGQELCDPVLGCPDKDPAGGGGGSTDPCVQCSRDCNNGVDILTKFRFRSSTFFDFAKDSWLDGEIEMLVFFHHLSGNSWRVYESKLRFLHIKHKDVKNLQWYYLDEPIWDNPWRPPSYSPPGVIDVSWYEQDGGNVITASNTVTHTLWDGQVISSGIDYLIQSGDDYLGEAKLYYCDNTTGEGALKRTTGIEFSVRQ